MAAVNPNIVKLWWDIDKAATEAVRNKHTNESHGIVFSCQSGMLFVTLPSGRRLAYVKPRIGENQFGGSCITYEGVGSTKKWERLETYGPKLVENIVQATSRDILCYAMKTLRCCSIVMHIHDELVIEADQKVSLEAICEQMVQRYDFFLNLQTWIKEKFVPLQTFFMKAFFVMKEKIKPFVQVGGSPPLLSSDGGYSVRKGEILCLQ